MTNRVVETEALLTPAEVATIFRVDPKTVTRWANSGKLTVAAHTRWSPPLPRVRGPQPLGPDRLLTRPRHD